MLVVRFYLVLVNYFGQKQYLNILIILNIKLLLSLKLLEYCMLIEIEHFQSFENCELKAFFQI